MSLDVIQIATITISYLVPFLIEMGKDASRKMAETIGEKIGEATTKEISVLWNKLVTNTETKNIVNSLARNPNDKKRQKIAIEDLAAYLQNNLDLASELKSLLGEQETFQKMIVDKRGRIEDATQTMEGSGQQIISSKNKGIIKGVHQIKRR